MYAIRSYYGEPETQLNDQPNDQIDPLDAELDLDSELSPTVAPALASTKVAEVSRITSYNVCYTKLLRFPEVVINMSKIGEEGGELARMLWDAAQHIRNNFV